ncbi:hypothetical protein N9545_10350, partial [Salibacteraceae bacterium]|nr:hypothetical protein [Salibacteraceae bacterium]
NLRSSSFDSPSGFDYRNILILAILNSNQLLINSRLFNRITLSEVYYPCNQFLHLSVTSMPYD